MSDKQEGNHLGEDNAGNFGSSHGGQPCRGQHSKNQDSHSRLVQLGNLQAFPKVPYLHKKEEVEKKKEERISAIRALGTLLSEKVVPSQQATPPAQFQGKSTSPGPHVSQNPTSGTYHPVVPATEKAYVQNTARIYKTFQTKEVKHSLMTTKPNQCFPNCFSTN